MSDLEFWRERRRRQQLRIANASQHKRAAEVEEYEKLDAIVPQLEERAKEAA